MSLSLAAIWRISRRDLSARIRGLRLLAICLFLGVATLAAIGSLTAGISDELSRRGQTILGGDIEIGIAQREANVAELAALQKTGTVSQTVRLRAMAIGEDSLLAELKAIDGVYPHYGALKLRGGAAVKAPGKGEIYIGPTLSERLDIETGGVKVERFMVLSPLNVRSVYSVPAFAWLAACARLGAPVAQQEVGIKAHPSSPAVTQAIPQMSRRLRQP